MGSFAGNYNNRHKGPTPPKPPSQPNSAQSAKPHGATPPKRPALYAGPEGPVEKFNTNTPEGQLAYEDAMRRAKTMNRDTQSYADMSGITYFNYSSTKRRPEGLGNNLHLGAD